MPHNLPDLIQALVEFLQAFVTPPRRTEKERKAYLVYIISALVIVVVAFIALEFMERSITP